MLRLLTLLCLGCLMSCSSVSVIPLSSEFKGNQTFPPSEPQAIGIFKETVPFKDYQEIGIITMHSGNPDINASFKDLRSEAAKHGADAIINYKLTSVTTTDPVTSTSCAPNGACTTSTSTTTYTTYTVVGTLVRRK